jgi:hypothetical protein
MHWNAFDSRPLLSDNSETVSLGETPGTCKYVKSVFREFRPRVGWTPEMVTYPLRRLSTLTSNLSHHYGETRIG